MAKFNPDVPDTPDKSYLNLSKPIGGLEGDQSGKYAGQAIGTLAAGAGQIFTEIVKGADETIKSIIDTNVRQNVNDERGALMTQIQNLGKKNPSIFADDSDNGGEDSAVPEQVGSQTEALEYKANNLRTGSESGKFPLSYYSMRLESGLKELRDRFPGHVDYIDKTGERISGENSANKAWQRMLAEYQAGATSGQKDMNKLMVEAKGWADKTSTGMAAYTKLMQGEYGADPAQARLNYYKEVGPEITKLGTLHSKGAALTVADKENANTWKVGEALAEDWGYSKVHDYYGGMRIAAGASGKDGNTAQELRQILDKNVMAPAGTKMSEEQALEKKFYGQQLEERAVNDFKQTLLLPTDEHGRPDKNAKGPTLASRMGPEASKKIDEIVNKTIRPMFKQSYEDFTPTKITVATYNSLVLDAKFSAFKGRMMGNEDIARMMNTQQMLEKTPDYLRGLIIQQMGVQKENFLLPWSVAASNDIIEAHRDANDSKITAAGQIVDRMVSADPAKTIYNDKDYKNVNDLVKGITNPTTNDPLKRAIAYRFFFPENKGYIAKFTAGADRSATWNTAVNPDMTKEMYRLGESHPEYWQNYKNWAHQEFGNEIFGQTLKDLSKLPQGLAVEWNTASNHWDIRPTKPLRDYSAGYRMGQAPGPKEDPDAALRTTYEAAKAQINTLNQHLDTLSNIGKTDKAEGDVGNYLLRTMAKANPDIAKMPGVPGDMYRTILNAKKAEVEPPQNAPGKPQDAPGSRKNPSPTQSTRQQENNAPDEVSPIPHYSPEESRKNIEALFAQFDKGTNQLVLDRKTGKYVPYEPSTIVKDKSQDRVSKK